MSLTFKISNKDLIVKDDVTGNEVILLDTGTEYKSIEVSELKTYIISATYIKTTEPTVNDDDINGYNVGDKGYDNVGKEVYILIDNTTGNANGQNTTLDVNDLQNLFDEKADKTITDGIFGTYDNGSQSGAITLNLTNGATQESIITGNITGITCDLSATYPYLIWDIETNGNDYTFVTTGYVTDNSNPILLPNTGKARLLFSLDADGTTKHLDLVKTNVG